MCKGSDTGKRAWPPGERKGVCWAGAVMWGSNGSNDDLGGRRQCLDHRAAWVRCRIFMCQEKAFETQGEDNRVRRDF